MIQMMLPQRRRPTASARRQQEVAPVAKDDPVVPADIHAPSVEDDPVVAADVHAAGVDAANDAEGFPGEPRDPSVLIEYADHVAVSVWNEEKLGRPAPEIEGLITATGLSPLIAFSVDTGDRGLISSFVERWHRETSSFHLLMGKFSITLDDVMSLLHLPIIGTFHTFEPLHINEAVLMLVELLEVSREAARAETAYCHGPYSATHVHVVFLDALRDLSQSGSYAWGAAALVHMYDHLNDACRSSIRQLAGYITLLQHFSSVAKCMADPDYDEVSPHACRWITMKAIVKSIFTATYRQHLDRLRIPDVRWMPYGEHRPF
ncbi:protein MAIN-LIKE 1-like [Glycine soja]|uniref:protein MAIN-LIKE 1-like n=1 Tax=Glycine soja TaxID=3848 RepID=UPI001038C763|nr:protein MAIN-LIKE 1-like [Glycine soja]